MNHVTRFAYDENNNTKYRSFHCDPKKYIIAGLSIGSPGKHFPMNRSYIAAPNIGPYVCAVRRAVRQSVHRIWSGKQSGVVHMLA